MLHDIRTVAARRFPGVGLILRPAQVQGEGAEDIAAGLREVAALPQVDVVIVGRGGGMEDLWAFNEEQVVRAIAACPKPVISCRAKQTSRWRTCRRYARAHALCRSELAVPDRLGCCARCKLCPALGWRRRR